MTAIRRMSVLVPAVLLAAATAAADTVVTDKEVIKCRVISCDIIFTRLEMPSAGTRTFYTRDVREIRLSDSTRVADLAARLPGMRVILDSGQPVPALTVRRLEMLRVRLARAREARAKGLPAHLDIVDKLPLNASPAEMVANCREMYGVLLECGQSNDTIAVLLGDVEREEQALRGIWPSAAALCLPGLAGCVSLGIIGAVVYGSVWVASQTSSWDIGLMGAYAEGGGLGGAVGATLGAALGANARRRTIVAHRGYVSTLVHRVNRAVVATP